MSETTAELLSSRPLATWWMINGLGLFAFTMYGVAYYALTTTVPEIARDFDVAASTIFGVYSVGFFVTAFLAPQFGRWTQRLGSGRVLLLGTLSRATALVAMTLAPDFWSFSAALVVCQIMGQLTEYDAVFAAAVGLSGERARTAISQITLWGGLASTAFWPLTALMLESVSWRSMFLIYAALIIVVCVPVALWVLARARRDMGATATNAPATVEPSSSGPASEPGKLVFATLATAFALAGVAYSLPVIMLPMLKGLGLSSSGLLAGALFGPSQTAGRFFDFLFGRNVHPLRIAVLATGLLPLSLVLLLLGGGATWSVMAFAVLFGAGAGVSYIVRGSVVLALYPRKTYALWLGRLASVRLIVSASAPFVLSRLLEAYGASSVVLLCVVTASLATACFLVLERRYA